jgi:O-antigen/teichoic acid export membrane protein
MNNNYQNNLTNSSRTHKAIGGLYTSLIQYGITIILQIILTPMVLKTGGKEVLGAYSFLMQLVSWAALADLGFGVAVTINMSKAFGKDDNMNHFSKVFSTGRTFFIFSNLFFACILLILNLRIHDLLKMTASVESDFNKSVYLLAIWVIIRTPLSLYNDGLISTQNLSKVNSIGTLSVIIRLSLSLIFLVLKYGLVGLMIANIISELISSYLCYFYFYKLYPNLKFSWKISDKNLFKKMFRFGFSYMIVMISGRLSSSSDSLFIGYFFGASIVAIFYTSQMPGTLLYQLVWKISDNSSPAINELHALESKNQLLLVYFKIFRYSLICTIPLALGIIIFNKSVISLWVGVNQYGGLLFTILLAFFSITQIVIHLNCVFLIAFEKTQFMRNVFLSTSLIKFIFSLLLVPKFSIDGIMFTNLFVDLIVLISLNKMLLKLINTNYNELYKESIRPAIISNIFPIIIFIYMISPYSFKMTNWTILISLIFVFSFTWIVNSFFGGINKEEKKHLFLGFKNLIVV